MDWRARDSLFFEPLVALAIVAVLLVSLYAYTANWPPVYAIESNSMQHGSGDHVGFLNAGDIVLAQKVSLDSIVPYVIGVQTGFSTYGEPGDVLLYYPYGQTSQTPIIHRAIFFLQWNPGNSTYNATDLGGLLCADSSSSVSYYTPGTSGNCGLVGLTTGGYDRTLPRRSVVRPPCDRPRFAGPGHTFRIPDPRRQQLGFVRPVHRAQWDRREDQLPREIVLDHRRGPRDDPVVRSDQALVRRRRRPRAVPVVGVPRADHRRRAVPGARDPLPAASGGRREPLAKARGGGETVRGARGRRGRRSAPTSAVHDRRAALEAGVGAHTRRPPAEARAPATDVRRSEAITFREPSRTAPPARAPTGRRRIRTKATRTCRPRPVVRAPPRSANL